MIRTTVLTCLLSASLCLPARGQQQNDASTIAADHHRAGIQAYQEKRIVDAEQLLKRAIATDKDYLPARYDLAALLQQIGRKAEALEAYKVAATDVAKDDAEAHHRYAVALSAANQLKPAVEQLNESLRLDPRRRAARRDLVKLLLTQQSYMQAAGVSADGVKLHSEDASAHNDHGVVLMRLGKSAAAVDSFTRAIELDATHPDALYNAGLALLEQWRLEEAETRLKQALEKQPTYTDAMYNLGRVYRRMERFEEAVGQFEDVLKADKKYSPANFQLAEIQFARGDYKKAASNYTQSLRLRPGHPQSQLGLGRVMRKLGRPQLAIPQFEGALLGKQDYPEAHFELAEALRESGRISESLSHYRHAIAQRSDWVQPHLRLAEILSESQDKSIEDPEAAKRHASKAKTLAEAQWKESLRLGKVISGER